MKFNEGQITSADAKEIFKVATNLHNKPTGLGRIFKGLRKNTIDVNDLQQAWKDEGFPDDTRDLVAILKDHGFAKQEIDKVFQEVFGNTAENTGDEASPTIQKIVDYAKEHDLVEPLKVFLQREYGFTESFDYGGKVVVEDIRQIFTSIVREERTARLALIRTQEQTQLGRTKK